MSKIVPFRKDERRRRKRREAETAFELLFFTGVRYMRHEDDNQTADATRPVRPTKPTRRRA
ncbi:MAG: hypothetical protein RL735_2182 [Pseudomonadota bacterium]|jgi:hypothetical protein